MKNSLTKGKKPEMKASKLELVALELNLEDEVARLATDDRRKAFQHLEQLALKAGLSSNWEPWSNHEIMTCYRNLLPISQTLAQSWRRWARRVSDGDYNTRLILACIL